MTKSPFNQIFIIPATTCDCCLSPLVSVEIEMSWPTPGKTTIQGVTAKVEPMVCAFGQVLCLQCADDTGLSVRHIANELSKGVPIFTDRRIEL